MHYVKRRLMFLAVCGIIILTGLFTQFSSPPLDVVPASSALDSDKISLEELSLTGLDEQTYTLSQWSDKPLIVTFFASWCEVCAETLPVLTSVYEEEKDQVHMVAINATTEERNKKDVASFAQAAELTIPVLYDEGGEAKTAFQIVGVPATFVIDTNGRIQATFYGPVSSHQIHQIISTNQ